MSRNVEIVGYEKLLERELNDASTPLSKMKTTGATTMLEELTDKMAKIEGGMEMDTEKRNKNPIPTIDLSPHDASKTDTMKLLLLLLVSAKTTYKGAKWCYFIGKELYNRARDTLKKDFGK